jgi:methyl-accepting chemotaxis protein
VEFHHGWRGSLRFAAARLARLRRLQHNVCRTMRLTTRLVLWFFGAVVIALGINGWLGVRGELERYEADLDERHVVMGRVLRAAFSEVLATDGELRAVSMLEYTDKRFRSLDIRWVHLDEGAPAERRPAVELARLAPLQADLAVHARSDGKRRSYVPTHVAGRPVSALEISESLDGERAVVRRAVLREVRAVALAIGLAATVLGIMLVARPMKRLVLHARRVGAGDLSPMSVPGGRDEIAVLAREMNVSLDELERRYVARVLDAVGGNKSSASRVLGIDRTTLYRMLDRFGLR